MFDRKVLHIYSNIIGYFFLISGFGKAIDTAGFSDLIRQYGLGYLSALSPLIVIAEIILGLLLVLLVRPKQVAGITLILLLLFTLAFAWAYIVRGVTDCGCFGSVFSAGLPPALSFLRNFILIGMSLILWIKYPAGPFPAIAPWKRVTLSSVLCLSCFAAGYTFENPFLNPGEPDKHQFQDMPVRETELSLYLRTSPDSTYLVFCFSYTCPHCLNSIENLEKYFSSGTVDRVLAIATGTAEDKAFFEQEFHPGFGILDLPGNRMGELTDVYPTAFFIRSDTVRIIIRSVLPSTVTFGKYYQSKF